MFKVTSSNCVKHLYHRSLWGNFKLQIAYSPQAANILTSVDDPPTLQFSLHKQHNICVAITGVQAVCAAVVWNTLKLAKLVTLIQGRNI